MWEKGVDFQKGSFPGSGVMILTKRIITGVFTNFKDGSQVGRTTAVLKGGMQKDPEHGLISISGPTGNIQFR